MKKIALLVQDLDSDYFTFMVDGAKRYCQKHGHQLFVFIIRSKNWNHGSFDYQFYVFSAYFLTTRLLSKNFCVICRMCMAKKYRPHASALNFGGYYPAQTGL